MPPKALREVRKTSPQRVVLVLVAAAPAEADDLEKLGDAPAVVPAQGGEHAQFLVSGQCRIERRRLDERTDAVEVADGSEI
jgi:hypothetical protein